MQEELLVRKTMTEEEIELNDQLIGAKRSKTFKSIEDRKMRAALRAELGDDDLTSEEYNQIFS